jgi:DNA polymerase
MDERRRLQYLEAMGIDVWLPVAGNTVVLAREKSLFLSPPHPNSSDAVQDRPFDGAQDKLLPEGEGAHEATIADVTGQNAAPLETESAAADAGAVPPTSVGGMDWETLQQTVAQCRRCGLCETRTQTVFGVGNKQTEWMLIGEAPGQQEDLQGEPFVGKAGQLLTEMLRAMGLARDAVYIANVLKCRPPNNRDPKPEERAACDAYLRRQIALIKPKMILAVGRIAAQHLLQSDAPIGALRGKVHYLGDIPLLVIYHPAYLLRSLLEKRKTWGDLQTALRVFRELV